MKTNISLHAALHSKNPAGLLLYGRHGDYWFRHHITSGMILYRNELYRTHGLSSYC